MKMAESPIWEARGAAKRQAVQGMFAEIAGSYDRVNSLMSLFLHHRWRSAAVKMLQLRDGDSALDLCCGTGDFFAPLRSAVGPTGQVFGVDFCEPMLRQAQQKFRPTPLSLGDAGQLPLRPETVNGVTVGWGIRNLPDIDQGHREIFRVLRPGGRFASIDMAFPRNPIIRWFSVKVCGVALPRLGALIGHSRAYTYLPKSVATFPSRELLAASMERAGFVDILTKDLFFGNICIHFGRKP